MRGEMALGYDLYIEARIREKDTGRVISCGGNDKYVLEEAKGFFQICWWCGYPECDVRIKMIEICNSHGGTDYTDADSRVPVPPSALREIYAYIVKCCYLSEDEYSEAFSYGILWYERSIYEKTNLLNANKLHDLLITLEEIKHEKTVPYFLFRESIANESDLKNFESNPLEYEWEFRIWNSH